MIITGYDQYNILIERMNREDCIIIPIFRDIHYHRMENAVLCVGVVFVTGETFIVSISHKDAPMFDIPSGSKCLTIDDINALAYVNNKHIPEIEYTAYVHDTHNKFGNSTDANKLIPLMSWGKIIKEYASNLLAIFIENSADINSDKMVFAKSLLSTLKNIENSGLCVSPVLLEEYFGSKTVRSYKSDFVYSQYNPYTVTNRPSNRFGGINFSALNKSDGSRDIFISRYQNGCLVQFDFEAYHLRLIADILDVKLPTGNSIHLELAKMYFNTDIITDDLYAQSKSKTFEIMYGMSNETYGFELFEKIHMMRQMFQNETTIELPSGMTVAVEQPNASKLFNYYMQSLEIVQTLPKLNSILNLLQNTNNKLILYTYDSILVDMENFDHALIHDMIEILEENKKFPVRVYSGNTYNNIKEIRL
jgi:hypothetical protein